MNKKSYHLSRSIFRPQFLLVSLFFIGIYFLTGLIKIKNIDCVTQFGYCDHDITEAFSWLKDYPILRPLPRKAANEKLQGRKEIAVIKLHRRLPSTLVVSILLRQPIGAVSTSVLGASSLVDASGQVYGHSDAPQYPLLIIPHLNSPPDSLDPLLQSALNDLFLISSLTDTEVTGFIEDNYLIASLSSQTQVLLDPSTSQDFWYPSLQAILTRSKIKAKMPKKIDLRFNSSVLLY